MKESQDDSSHAADPQEIFEKYSPYPVLLMAFSLFGLAHNISGLYILLHFYNLYNALRLSTYPVLFLFFGFIIFIVLAFLELLFGFYLFKRQDEGHILSRKLKLFCLVIIVIPIIVSTGFLPFYLASLFNPVYNVVSSHAFLQLFRP